MGEARTIPVEVMLPVDDAAEDVASDVATALNALCERLAIPGRVVVESRPTSSTARLVVNGRSLPSSWLADAPTSADPGIADRARWGSWATTLASQWPGTLVTEEGAAASWAQIQADRPMPQWYVSGMRATVSLGVPASAIAQAPEVLAEDRPWDARVLAEKVAAQQDRWLRLFAAPSTLRHVIESTEPSEAGGRLDNALRAHLGPLRAVMPALTYVPDPTVPEGSLTVRLGELTLLTCAVPPPGTTFLWSWAPPEEQLAGYRGPAECAALHRGLWAWVDLDSDAERALGGGRDDYLTYVLATALMATQEKLADLEAATTLFDALFQHVGTGHTMWFARAVLDDEHLLVTLRAMLRDRAPITQLGALLRELLVTLDLRIQDDGFATALAVAQGRWRVMRATYGSLSGTPLRLDADLVEALATAARGWDEWLPTEGIAAERLRDEVRALSPVQVLLVVPDDIRSFVDAVLRIEGADLTVLGESDLARRYQTATETRLGVTSSGQRDQMSDAEPERGQP